MFTTSARQGGTDTESVAGPGATTTQLKSQAPQGFAAFGASTPVGWEEPDPDLTGSYGSAKLGELPRMALTEKSVRVDGARPLLENSTACQKSMPTNPVRWVGTATIVVGRHRTGSNFLWY